MKKCCLAVVFVIALNFSAHAYEGLHYYWSFGDIGISWENLTRRYDVATYLNVGNFNWITRHGLGFGFNFLNMEGRADWTQMLILPVELSYSPFRNGSNNPIFTFYGRGGLMTRLHKNGGSFWNRSGFFGAAGFRASWVPLLGNSWSVFNNVFIEYTTKNQLRIGVSIDVTIFSLIWLYITAESN